MKNNILLPVVKRNESALMRIVLEDRRNIILAILDILESHGIDEAKKRLAFALSAIDYMLKDLEEEDLIIKIIRKG